MAIDYDHIRKASSPDGLIDLLAALGHEPMTDWDSMADVRQILLDNNVPASVRHAVADDALTIREATSLLGPERGIECYVAILRPGLNLTAATCRNLSHAFRHASGVTRIDETFLFIGTLPAGHEGELSSSSQITDWATVHLGRIYRKAGAAEELRLARLDWKPTRKNRHTLDCLSALRVDALPGQVEDDEAIRFSKAVKDWFNKERLSRRFFKQFYRRFESGLDLIQRHAAGVDYDPFKPTKNKPVTKYTKEDRKGDSNREAAAKYLLKQTLRLLFLHFLQEKEWLCRDKYFLTNQWRRYEEETRSIPNYDATTATGFHEQVLIPLFFETLNQRRPDDAADNWGPTRWDSGDRAKMPYLNGGIFDIDKVVDHWDFEAEEPLILIPDAVFSADRDYDPQLDDDTLKGRQVNFLAFLDDYHFTIAEDTPVDEAVALDPELMGKIFENLLVSRHSDGAYYTPRSIVRFQCKDTLARYLEEQMGDLELDHDWFLTLFDLDRDFSQQQTWDDTRFTNVVADRIEAALSECKVLDPAVGSGAYLLGMLTEMLRLRQLCHMVRTGNMVDRGSIQFYRWKSEIIEASLYGVDINPQAVAICHLRLWLVMVVDQDRDAASPLPNLDYQITPGDSLRSSINGHEIFVPPGQTGQATLWTFGIGGDDGPSEAPILARIKRIRELRHAYFDEDASPSRRDETRLELQSLRQEMMLEGLDQLEQFELKQLKGKKMSPTKRDKVENDTIAKFNETRTRIEEGSFTSIFSYSAIFGDVFQREGRRGFDIVIGNPPYLEDEGKGGYDDIQELLELKSNNLYAMFWIRSIRDLTRPGGQVSFITSDTFLTIRSHQETRRAILKESRVHYAIQAGNWFFTFNNAWTAILTVTTRDAPLTEDEAWDVEDQMVAYDITKLPPKDLAALEKALDLWKPGQASRARTANIDAHLVDEGNDTSWYLELDTGGRSYIGRYAYPRGLPLRNSNLPLFHACPKLFKLTWDTGPWEPRPRTNLLESEGESDWRDHVPRTVIEFNGEEIELVKLKEIADVKVGLQTGDDTHYLRKVPGARGSMPEIRPELVVKDEELELIRTDESLRQRIIEEGFSEDMFEGRHFVPFAKPPSQSDGNLNMFYTPVEYYIDWSVDSVSELYNFTRADVRRRLEPGFNGTAKQESERAAVIRNPSFYFSNCLHASSAGEEAPQVWAPWGGISGHKSSIVVPIRLDWKALLCLMSSHPFSLLVKPYRGSLADTGQEQLSMTSVPMNASTIDFGESIDSLIQKKKSGGILTRNDPEWNGVDKAISQALSFAQEDEAEVFLWRTRRFSRPGVIE